MVILLRFDSLMRQERVLHQGRYGYPKGEIMTLNEEIQESMRVINECCREIIRLSAELRELLEVKK